MKNIALIGGSGSIGKQTLNVLRRYPDKFKLFAYTVNTSVDEAEKVYREFHPKYIGIADEKSYLKAKSDFPKDVLLSGGQQVLSEASGLEGIDIVVVAVVGMRGLRAVISAIEHGKTIALANKESLVAGGEVVTRLANKSKVQILPVDSEHSAVFQCLIGTKNKPKKIILTASGGSFYNLPSEELDTVTPEMATSHPNWSMGKKITVDSSTMMNKGLEIIEARWLFDTVDIDYIIHPESIIHSMVEFNDGAILAQLGIPNMELPIQFALTYPERLSTNLSSLSFTKPLNFFPPDEKRFPFPALCKNTLLTGGNSSCIVNAANEGAVQLFLNRLINFTDIYKLCEKTLESAHILNNPSLEDIYLTHETTIAKLMRDYKTILE